MFQRQTCKVDTHSFTKIDQKNYQKYYQMLHQDKCKDYLAQSYQIIGCDQNAIRCTIKKNDFALPIRKNASHLYTMEVKINQRPCHFIIDTGAQISLLKQECANQLKLTKTKGSLMIKSAQGKQKPMQAVIVDTLDMKGRVYHNLPLLIMKDFESFSSVFKHPFFYFDGILGWDILRNLDFEIDDQKKLFKSIKNKFVIEDHNMIAGSFLSVLVKSQNKNTLCFGFDTGAYRSWINEDIIKIEGYKCLQKSKQVTYGVHGLETKHQSVIYEALLYLDKAKITLHHPRTGLVQLFSHFSYAGILGNEVFKNRRIRFINSENRILLA